MSTKLYRSSMWTETRRLHFDYTNISKFDWAHFHSIFCFSSVLEIGPCSTNPCLNMGICISIIGGDAKCVCPSNYIGLQCEFNTNPSAWTTSIMAHKLSQNFFNKEEERSSNENKIKCWIDETKSLPYEKDIWLLLRYDSTIQILDPPRCVRQRSSDDVLQNTSIFLFLHCSWSLVCWTATTFKQSTISN